MNLVNIILLSLILIQTSYLVFAGLLKNRNKRGVRPIFVDTSVLIDGRIVSIAQSGFVYSPLFIPRSVIGELQVLADNGDSDKRTKARHGLDVISELQAIASVQVKIFSDSERAEEGVDSRLLKLAKRHGGALCTIDYNLIKVALVEDIKVLNINDLAMGLRMPHLPGEKIAIELVQKGQDAHQAVGYIGDGTMVVVERASQFVGQTVEIEFIRSLQTAAGKMMFAKLAGVAAVADSHKRPSKSKPRPKN